MPSKSFHILFLLAAFCFVAWTGKLLAQNEFEWKNVTDKFGQQLTVKENVQTGAAHRVYGKFVNISHYGVSPSELSFENVDKTARKFLSDYQDIIKISPDNLSTVKTRNMNANWYLSYQQIYEGIPVFSTHVGFTIEKDGRIRCIGADIYSDIEAKTTPLISDKQALEIAETDFKTDGVEEAELVKEISLLIYPEIVDTVINYYLVYSVELSSPSPTKQWIYFVDAFHGGIIHRADAFRDGDWNIHGKVRKKYFPEYESDTPVSYGGLEGVQINIHKNGGLLEATGQTNTSGLYDIDWVSDYNQKKLQGTKNLNLVGDWCKILNGETKTHEYFFYPSHVKRHDWYWATDETNVFYHAGVAHDYWTSSPFDFEDMNYQMKGTVHAGDNINGKSTGTDVKFGTYRGVNWALYSDVVYHEYAHCVIYHIYDGWIEGNREACAMDEGFPDYFACSMNNDPLWGDGINGVPDLPRNLDNDLRRPDDWEGGDCHLNGRIIAGACWDMRQSIGDETTDKLVFEALQYEPQAYWFDDFADNVLFVDSIFYDATHWEIIDDCFHDHGINTSINLLVCQQVMSKPNISDDSREVSAADYNYFPLRVGNTWYYGYPIPPSNPWEIKTIRDSLFINGLTYYIWTYGDGVSIFDTLRADEQGNIWKYHHAEDYLWFDFRSDSGAVYYFPPMDIGQDEREKCKVYVERNLVVETPAGTFENCISFKFDVYQERDEEITYFFAEEVGPIAFKVGLAGTERLTGAIINGKIIASVDNPTNEQKEYLLLQSYPNPFNSWTNIRFDLPEKVFVTLQVFDVLGHYVRTLTSREMQAGSYTVAWDGKSSVGEDVAAGVYFANLRIGSEVRTIKLLLVR